MEQSNLFGGNNSVNTKRKVGTLSDLTLGEDKFKFSTGSFYEHEFNRFFSGFTKEEFSKYSDRKELLEWVSCKTGNRAHKVVSTNDEPFEVHFFGEILEVEEYRYVVRSGLLFDPTLMPEGKTESVLVDEYLQVLAKLNEDIELEFYELDKGQWVSVTI